MSSQTLWMLIYLPGHQSNTYRRHIFIGHKLIYKFFKAFHGQKGKPTEIRSDNGGNFVGAERELKEAIANWNQEVIHNFLLQKSIKWSFNPPYSSQFPPWRSLGKMYKNSQKNLKVECSS